MTRTPPPLPRLYGDVLTARRRFRVELAAWHRHGLADPMRVEDRARDLMAARLLVDAAEQEFVRRLHALKTPVYVDVAHRRAAYRDSSGALVIGRAALALSAPPGRHP
jgi:hypothetical protein